jgi:cell division protein FtsW (lipid II flippase)
VPVVQFDFPAAFLIGRFGLGFAWVLICVQSTLLLLGAVGFLQILKNDAGSEIDARARRFLSIVLFGSVTLFALHWTISWSNALGLFPVMGQPMSWLSAGVSHQILMVFPCVIAMIVALRYGRFVAFALRFRMPPR